MVAQGQAGKESIIKGHGVSSFSPLNNSAAKVVIVSPLGFDGLCMPCTEYVEAFAKGAVITEAFDNDLQGSDRD